MGLAATALAAAALCGAMAAAPAPTAASGAPWVRLPAGPWPVGNTAPRPPTVTWSGPALVTVDAPENVTAGELRAAPGGPGDRHLLYTDGPPRLSGGVWPFVFVKNALSSESLDITLTVRAEGSGAHALSVLRGAAARVGPSGVTGGAAVAASVLFPAAMAWRRSGSLAAGAATAYTWTVPAGQVLTAWWPVRLTGLGGAAAPLTLSVWESPAGEAAAAPEGGPLPLGASGVMRDTAAHVRGAVRLPVPAVGAVAWDLDNDAPEPGGASGGTACPAFICMDGEVTTWDGAPWPHAADPLPGEAEPGVDAVDLPAHGPAVAVWQGGRLIRTGNYGDYGCVLSLTLLAPPGRRVMAAAVSTGDHGIPWAGFTAAVGAPPVAWRLPNAVTPPGWGRLLVNRARRAQLVTTLTAGAYAPWRLVVWSVPAGSG